MASEPISITAPEPAYRSPWQRWTGFWFPAADPTTLGFIRIVAGLLVLYVHLSYSLDLQGFFGKHAWYSTAHMERERHEYPWQVTPFWNWKIDSVVTARLPDYPHRRKPVVDFIRALPEDDAARLRALRFLQYISDEGQGPENPILALNWFQDMGMYPERRDRHLDELVRGEIPPNEGQPGVVIRPRFLFNLPKEQREQRAAEVRAFWDILPNDRANPNPRAYVLDHFTEITPEVRRATVTFMVTLPADQEARTKKIDYLEYWNNETDKTVQVGQNIFSVWFHVTDPTQMALIHVAILVAMFLFTVGLFTRVTSVIVWLAVLGYIHRAHQVLFGMDTMMNILLFYMMIGNSGGALSIDRLIARYRAARASLRRTGTIDPATQAFLDAPPPSRSAGFAIRLIQVHFCFIYIASGLAKLKGAAWWEGRSVWEVMVNPEFTMMQHEWYEKSLRAMARIKPFYYAFTVFGSWFTLFIEIAGPFLLWTRLRWLIILLATVMHAIIGVTMGLNLFELLMIVMLLAFLPDQVIRDRLRGAPGLPKLKFAFDPASSARAAALVAAADTDGQVTLTPDPAPGGPVLTDASGRHAGAGGVATLFRSVRALSPFSLVLRVPGVQGRLARLLFPVASSSAPR